MDFTRLTLCAAAFVAGAVCLHAQDVPAGWKVIKDRAGKCQFAVPPDWTPDSIVKSFQMAPNGGGNAVASSAATGPFAQVTATAKQLMTPTKTIEDSAKRLWYVYETQVDTQKGMTDWYVAVPTSPVCSMQITFKGAALEDTAKKIALSLTAAK
jgi:hypothetical protein